MIVRLHYADGSVEDHPLDNGVAVRRLHPRRGRPRLEARLPAPRPAGPLPRRRSPRRRTSIDRIELVKGPDETAPVVMAVTVEGDDGGK